MRVWIEDRWTRSANATLADGSTAKVAPPAAQLRKLSTLEDRFKTDRFGRGRRWRVVWYAPDDTGVKRQRRESYTSRSAAEARRDALAEDQRVGRYIDPRDARKTVSEAYSAWLASKQSIKPATIRRYQRDAAMYVLPRWKDVTLDQVTSDDINSWVSNLRDGTAPRDYKNAERTHSQLSPNSIRGIVAVVFGGTVRFAVKRRWIAVNPAEDIELPRIDPDEPTFLTHDEVAVLADTAKAIAGDTSAALIRTLAYCGVRVGEAMALRCADFDQASRRLHIRHTWTVDEEGKALEGPPKTWERRSVPVPKFLVADLKRLMAGPEQYLFRAKRGGALALPNWRSRVWSQAVLGAGLDEVVGLNIHALRHTYASLAIAAGADVKTLQRCMGHKDATVTLNVYAGLWPDRLDTVADALSQAHDQAIAQKSSPPNHPQERERHQAD